MKGGRTKGAKNAAGRAAAVAAAQPAQGRRWLVFALGAFVALGLAFWAYQASLDAPFVLDDLSMPYMQPNYPAALGVWLRGLRPVLMFTYWLNYTPGGDAPTSPYHLWNVLLHWADAVVMFFLVRRILEWAKVEARRSDIFAAFAAAVFLLHPLQTESVAYIASRSEVLSVLLFNCAFLAFLYRRNGAVSVGAAAAVLALFAAAALSKEHTAVLPALLLLTDYYWNPGFSFAGIRRNWKLYAPLVLGGAAGGLYVLRVLRNNPTAGFAIKEFSWLQYFFTQCRVIWRYLFLFVVPVGQNLDPDVPVSRTVLDHGAIAGLAALVAVSAAAWVYRKRFPLGSYGWFATLLLLAPTSSLVPLRDVYAERRMYLPFVGLLLISIELLRRWNTSTRTLGAVLGVIVAAQMGLTMRRDAVWAGPIPLWQDTVAGSPEKFRPNFQLAKAYFDAGACGEAARQYARTFAIEPHDFRLLVDWGLALDCAQQPDEAIAKLELAKREPRPDNVSPAYVDSQIAKVYGTAKRYPEALAALGAAEKEDPGYDMTYLYRGTVFYQQGDAAGAEAQFRRAAQLNPNNPATQNALAVVERARQGRR